MAKDNVGSVYMDLELDNKKFDKGIKESSSGAESAFASSMGKIGGFIAKAFAVGVVVKFGTTAVKEASKMQSAWTGLNSIIQGTGGSFKQAQKFITEYTKDGLVSISEATTAYKNLLSRGYDTSQIENTMLRLKDSASFGRQASYQLGEAVVTATEGLKNENSILVDNAGVTKNVAKMWQEWAKAHGTTTQAMTQAQKIEAEYNGIMQETKHQVGDATAYTNTFNGKVSQLSMAFTNLKVAVGKVIAPIAQMFIPIITTAINAVTSFFNTIGTLMKSLGFDFPDVVSKSSSSIDAIGASASDASSDIEGVGDSASKTAKKINKAFASVDEIQVVAPTKNDSGGSGGGASAGGGVSTGISSGAFDEVADSAPKVTGAFDQIINKFKELQSLFMEGFNLTWNNKSFDKIIKSSKGIKNSLLDIFNNKDLQSAINNWSNAFALNLGKMVGSVAVIGTNIMEGLIGSMELYLSQNSGRIADFFTTMFTINMEQMNLAGQLWEVLASISEIFTSDTAIQIGSDILGMFLNPLMSVKETFAQFILDMESILVQPIVDNVDKIKTTFEGILKPVSVVTSTLNENFTHIGDTITKLYDEHIHPFFEDFKTGISDTFSKALDVYNEYVQPFVEKTAERFKDLWDNHLKPLWDNVAELFGALVDFIKMLWDQFLKPLIDWIIQNIVPKVVPILNRIGQVAHDVITSIVDFISGLLRSIKGILNFITGVFTGDWEKAWNGVKDIFGGIMDALVGIFKAPINWIIDGMNKFIDGLNKIQIPDWVPAVGGKGLNLSHIQRLANGGYVERNNPQLAVIGDNTREGEIVSPESKIYEQTLKALKDAGGATGKQEIEMTIYHKYEDGKTIIQKINQAQIDAGEVLLLT